MDLLIKVTLMDGDKEIAVSEIIDELDNEERDVILTVLHELAYEDKDLGDLALNGMLHAVQHVYQAIARATFVSKHALTVQPARAARGVH